MKKNVIKTVIFILILIMIDQVSKILISNNINLGASLIIINNFFSLTNIKNYGAAFGIFDGGRIIFLGAALMALVYIFYEMKKYINNKQALFGLILISAGIIGNFIDRLLLGYVRDFIEFKIFNYNFAIFNLADSFLVIGTIILLIYLFMEEKK